MHKLLITDLDDTLYDWSGFLYRPFMPWPRRSQALPG